MTGTWRTYTPDGRVLEIEHEDGAWLAICDGNRRTGATAHEAIAAAVGREHASIGTAEPEIEAWIAAQAARLESEAG